MSRGPTRSLIPQAYADLSTWPRIEPELLSEKDRSIYIRRSQAVMQYANGETFERIQAETGIAPTEVRRYVKRCLTSNGTGGILGFTALIGSARLCGYNRTADLHSVEPNGKGGYAGAWQLLLNRYPDLDDFITDLILKRSSRYELHEARITYVELLGAVKDRLKKWGAQDTDYPFNTRYHGYGSLIAYCNNLKTKFRRRWVTVRSGEDALSRGKVATGHIPILPCLRPYSFVQLDYQKIDAACIIEVDTPTGPLEFVVPRFYVGFIVEERHSMILGVYVSLETNPSAECTLETLQSALIPETFKEGDARVALATDGKILINQLVPELAYQCFSGIKIDNAWCNSANDVVNNMIDTFGCAVNFGPTYFWPRRAMVEQIIGQITRCGLQRLPSTYGTGPGDPRSIDPSAQALKYKISLNEIISIIYSVVKGWNTRRTEGAFHASPVLAIRNELGKPENGFFIQPLPRSVQADPKLLSHVQEVTVRGREEENKSPYFQIDRSRYYGMALSRRFDLIGKKLVTYTSRRDIRKVTVCVKETGEDLGNVWPEAKWREYPCSWRLRKLINRAGLSLRMRETTRSAFSEFLEKKSSELQSRARKKRNKSKPSQAALDYEQARRSAPVRKIDERRQEVTIRTRSSLNPFKNYLRKK